MRTTTDKPPAKRPTLTHRYCSDHKPHAGHVYFVQTTVGALRTRGFWCPGRKG